MSSVLGIDIGQNTVKAVCLSNNNNEVILESLGEGRTPKVEESKGVDKEKFLGEVGGIIKNLLENEVVFVEGAGGLLVPYKDTYTFLDLLVYYRQKAEVIVVATNVLGTINHTLLTIDVLKRNDIKINSVVFNNIDKTLDKEMLQSNVEAVKSFTNIKTIRELD